MLERHASVVAGLDLLVPRLLRHIWLLRQQQFHGPATSSTSSQQDTNLAGQSASLGLGPPPTPRRDSLFDRKEALLNVFDGKDIDEWIPRVRRTSATVMPGKVGAPSAPPSIATLLADEQEGSGGSRKHRSLLFCYYYYIHRILAHYT